ncbi:hypothetical protein EF847_19300 [Actinobacteria bacterium YIM 96077]|uniref:Rv1678 family membrane protein n=1 Tax=Phytoactinopolyspora halophila TaxID=1981511 RepID=UPI000F4F162E|nr:hypothetical protein [Phytoactinopolyspora halophila]AYY14520.1 hypothetical protein EF847_19300 [Actinobacteria bacterium YIM 96077]
MNERSCRRACLALGSASVASVVFVVEGLGDFRFMRVSGAALVIALVAGVLAMSAGGFARAWPAVTAGIGFVGAAVFQVISVAMGRDWLGASLSTASFWLGLGVGLIVVGCALSATRTGHDGRARHDGREKEEHGSS